MKQKFVLVIVIVIIKCFLYSESHKNLSVINPFITDNIYIEDYSAVRNKILKTVKEDYEIKSNGKKYYGDSEIKNKFYNYYFFDSISNLTDIYSISVDDYGHVLYKGHDSYIVEKNIVIVTNENIRAKSKVIKTFIIEENGNTRKFIFSDTDKNVKEEIVLGNEMKSIRIHSKNKNEKIDYYYDKGHIVKNSYYDSELRFIQKYYKGGLLEFQNCVYRKNDILLHRYEFDEDVKNGIYIESVINSNGKLEQERLLSKVIREYNNIGYLEKEVIEPYEKKEGEYSFFEAHLLSEKDEDFLLFFE